MKSFLKRRWLLLSCAIVLLVCSAMDLRYFNSWDTGMPNGPPSVCNQACGVANGNFYLARFALTLRMRNDGFEFKGFHAPMFGEIDLKWVTPSPNYRRAALSVWVPLGAVLGWIAFLELRWLEKRTKENSTADASK